MDPIPTEGPGPTMTMALERCDKCGSAMVLDGSGHGFERWSCPECRQVVGIDRDEVVGGRSQLRRGLPWRYSPAALGTGPAPPVQREQ